MSDVPYRLINRRVLATAFLLCALAVPATLGAQTASPALGTTFPLYVSSPSENAIYKIDSLGNKTLFTKDGMIRFSAGFPDGDQRSAELAVDRAGNVYAICVTDEYFVNTIVKIDPSGNQSLFAAGSLLGQATALAFDATGNLIVSNLLVNGGEAFNILRIAPDGTQSVYAVIDSDSQGWMRALAFDNNGLLYGVGTSNNSGFVNVWKIPPGGPLVAYASGLPDNMYAYAMAFGSWPHSGLNAGTLLVSQAYPLLSGGAATMTSVDGTGVTGTFSGLGYPTAFAFDEHNDLYLAKIIAGVTGLYKLDSSGNQTLFSALTEVPGAIAFTPAPPVYTFSGFLAPVGNPPAVNAGKAGRAYPLKWQVKDASGAFVSSLLAIQSMTVQTANCASIGGDSAATATPWAATGGSALRYDTLANQFTYNWASPSTPGCYKLSLTLSSGQVFTALFNLK
jgi:hypothetical protein